MRPMSCCQCASPFCSHAQNTGSNLHNTATVSDSYDGYGRVPTGFHNVTIQQLTTNRRIVENIKKRLNQGSCSPPPLSFSLLLIPSSVHKAHRLLGICDSSLCNFWSIDFFNDTTNTFVATILYNLR